MAYIWWHLRLSFITFCVYVFGIKVWLWSRYDMIKGECMTLTKSFDEYFDMVSVVLGF